MSGGLTTLADLGGRQAIYAFCDTVIDASVFYGCRNERRSLSRYAADSALK